MRRRPWSVIALVALAGFTGAGIVVAGMFDAYTVPTESMTPELARGDRFLARTSGSDDIRRGDIVVFRGPPDDIVDARISRVVALAGETIDVDGGRVLIDGSTLDESYLRHDTRTEGLEPLTVPAGSVYLLSDHRSDAQDSRLLGPVFTDRVIGPVAIVNVPVDRLLLGGVVITAALFLLLVLLPDRTRVPKNG